MLCLMMVASGDTTRSKDHSTVTKQISIKLKSNDTQLSNISQDLAAASNPEKYRTSKEGNDKWIWWYSVHMAAESIEQKIAFRKRLEDQKKKQELANDTRVWWYEVSEARDKYTGQPKQAFWKEENPDYEYEEGRLCNVTYSNSTEPRANQLETNATECSCLTWNSSIVFVLVMITIYATWATLQQELL